KLRQRPLSALLALILLGLLGLGVYVVGWSLWAEYHFQAARRELATLRDLDRRVLTRVRAHLALCLEVWPRSAETHFLAARTARRAGAYGAAEQHLTQCQQLQWPAEAVTLERAMLSAQLGELAPAVEEYLLSGISKQDPDVLLILEALTQGYLMTYRLA